MGLFSLLFFGSCAAGSAVGAGIENMKARQNVDYMLDGTPYYMDRKGTYRLLSTNEPISYDFTWEGWKYAISGQMICSKYDIEDAKALKEAKDAGKSVYFSMRRCVGCRCNIEIETDLIIARLERDKDHNCKIWYGKNWLNQYCHLHSDGYCPKGNIIHLYYPNWGYDEISEEKFERFAKECYNTSFDVRTFIKDEIGNFSTSVTM